MKRLLHGSGIAAAFLLAVMTAPAQPIGQWDFDDSDLSSTAGSALTYLTPATAAGTQFGTTTSLGIPDIAGQPAKVMRYGAFTAPDGFAMPFSAGPNGGGSLLNQYTLVMDILSPAASANVVRSLVETDLRLVAADADFAIDATGGIGGNGQFDGNISPNTWYRVGFVVDCAANTISKYINGALVGTQPATSGGTPALDGRWALDPGTGAELFNDDNGQVAPGFVNSIQLREVALSPAQMAALGGPSAAGIPLTIPAIPITVEQWIPKGPFASRNTDLGVVFNEGDNDVDEFAAELLLNGAPLDNLQIARQGSQVLLRRTTTVPLTVGVDYELVLSVEGSTDGQRYFTNIFRAALLFENFDELDLGPKVDEGLAGSAVWTKGAPQGWSIDDSGVPGVGTDQDGVTEWAGWAFANRDWWVQTAGDQDRSQFTRASGTVAVADPDEWDDRGHAVGLYNTFLVTPPIDLRGMAPNTVFLRFDSCWKPECCDDRADLDNDQTATVTVSYNGGSQVEVMHWSSVASSPQFHPDAPNEGVSIPLLNTADATNVVITFGLTRAENDWFWAIDNVVVSAGVLPPTIVSSPGITSATAGQLVTLSVRATGGAPLRYQWYKGSGASRTAIPGATSPDLIFAPVAVSDAGVYSCEVGNPGGAVFSGEAQLIVQEPFGGVVTDGLVVHLKFDDDAVDSSGRDNNGTEMGSVSYVPGRIGFALRYSSARDGSFFNYVSLGTPEDLNFGTGTNFSVSFWTKFTSWTGDPAFVANKNWNSGGNKGWVIATADDGRIQWNAATPRADYDSPGRVLSDTNWHHVVVSWDRLGLFTTYVDGVAINNTPAGAARDLTSGLPTNIGQDGTGTYTDNNSVGIADGTMDDLGIWQRAITESEVKAIYQAGLGGKDLSQAVVTPPTTKDLLTYLPFEDSLVDASGNGVDGTGVGSIGYAAGRVGRALAYSSLANGSSFNYVTLGRPAALDFGTNRSFAVSFWARLKSWSGDPAFIANKDWDSGNNPGWVIATDGDARVQWNIASTPAGANGNRRDFDSAGGIFSDLGWHHIVVEFDRSPGSGVGRTYVDGSLIRETIWTGADNNLSPAPGKATNIGQDGSGDYTDNNSVGVDAEIDEVAIWGRRIGASEVQGIYAAGLLGVPVLAASPSLTLQLPPGKLNLTPLAGRTAVRLTWEAKSGVRLQKATSLTLQDWVDVPCTTANQVHEEAVDPSQNVYYRLARP